MNLHILYRSAGHKRYQQGGRTHEGAEGRKERKRRWKIVIRGEDSVGCETKMRESEVGKERPGSKESPKIPK
jgi:hypothetical protein